MSRMTAADQHPPTTGPSQPVALAIRNVTKVLPLGTQRVTIPHDITLDIHASEFVAIVGPSGSGKSTLLGIITGLDAPTQGQVLVDGIDITHMSETRLAALRNARIGMVFQSFNLIPTLTAQENVEVPLYVGRRFKHPSQRAQEVLELVGLGQRLQNKPSQLSGGEQQRVAIARALVKRPILVLADEPTGELDSKTGDEIYNILRRLQDSFQTTLVVVTHDRRFIAPDDLVLEIQDGQLANGSNCETVDLSKQLVSR